MAEKTSEEKKVEIFNWASIEIPKKPERKDFKTEEEFKAANDGYDKAVKRVDKVVSAYKKIWMAALGPDSGTAFDEFLADCRDPEKIKEKGIKINGETFQNKLKEEIAKKKGLESADELDIKEVGRDGLAALGKEAENPTTLEDSVVKTYFAQAAVDGYLPYDTVTTAGLNVADGQSLQMGCGEGKTGVIVFAVAENVRNNKQVFLTSSTDILAAETMEDTARKYEQMGIIGEGEEKQNMVLISLKEIKYPKFENGKMVLNKKGKPEYVVKEIGLPPTPEQKAELLKAYSKKIVVADNATIMQHKMAGCIPNSPEQKENRVLMADEADFVLLDQYQPSQKLGREYNEKEAKQRTKYRIIARKVIEGVVKDPSLYRKDDANQYVDFTPAGKAKVAAIINEIAKKYPVNKEQMSDFIYEALVVETVYKAGRDYQIISSQDGKTKQIVSEHRASGAKIDLPQGILQALELKEGMKSSTERVVEGATNVIQTYEELFTKGARRYISGTLGTQSQSDKQKAELGEMGVTESSVYDCKPRDESQRETAPKTVLKDKAALRSFVIDSAEKQSASGKPVLIGCVSDAEVDGMIEELRKKDPNRTVIRYTATSEQEYKEIKSQIENDAFRKEYTAKLEELNGKGYSTLKDRATTLQEAIDKAVLKKLKNDRKTDKNKEKLTPEEIAEIEKKVKEDFADDKKYNKEVEKAKKKKLQDKKAKGDNSELTAEEIAEIEKDCDKYKTLTKADSDKLKRMDAALKAKEDIFYSTDLGKEVLKRYGRIDIANLPKDFAAFIKNASGQTNNIIVGTSIIGRGTTIKTNSKVQYNGGIHVIISGLHETSSRNQIQYAARTARGSDYGSVQEVMLAEELGIDADKAKFDESGKLITDGSKEGKFSIDGEEKTVDGFYDEHYKGVDERQSNVRTHVNNLVKALDRGYDAIDKSELSAKDKIKAKALLTERGFSIQNRACGYAGNEKQDEYVQEIQAFTDVYIAKFLNNDNRKESEILRDIVAVNGEDLYKADTLDAYMGYTQTKQKEIIRQYRLRNGISKPRKKPQAPAQTSEQDEKGDPKPDSKPEPKKEEDKKRAVVSENDLVATLKSSGIKKEDIQAIIESQLGVQLGG